MARRLLIDSTTKHPDTGEPKITDEERNRIEEIYQGKLKLNDDKEFEIKGTFVSDMPSDVGGSGSHLYLESPMGSVSYYSERFRGDLNLAGTIRERKRDLDEVVDLLIQWADTALGNSEEGQQLRAWIDGKLRRDLENLMLLAWSHRVAVDMGKEADSASFLANAVQYLVEHDYLKLRDVPKLSRQLRNGKTEELVSWITETVMRQAGIVTDVGDDDPQRSILRDPNELLLSLRTFLRNTDLYQELRKSREDNSTDPLWVLTKPVWPEFFFTVVKSLPANLKVNLQTSAKPFETNGQYEPASGQTRWQTSLYGRCIPMIVFAAWAEPDEAYQVDKLGKVLLKDAKLAEYVVWYHGLEIAERQKWDSLFATEESPEARKKSIADFKFEGEQGLAQVAKDLIRQ
ncbi:hypothetical protein [Neorhodopirellula pilleata]|nr:hypothetical protein [Neorhodopirellula pilleata]